AGLRLGTVATCHRQQAETLTTGLAARPGVPRHRPALAGGLLGEDAHRGRLARTVGTEDARHAARAYLERHVVEHPAVTGPATDPCHCQHANESSRAQGVTSSDRRMIITSSV